MVVTLVAKSRSFF